MVNRFCWIQSTFTLPEYFEGEKGTDFIHFGVGETKQTKKKQSYPVSISHTSSMSAKALRDPLEGSIRHSLI